MQLAKIDRSALIEHMPFLLALLFYALTILIVSPQGNFPLNDDYVYGLSVKTFLETGQFNFYSSSSSCILHLLTGAGLSSIFGFSFETLRWVSLFYGFISLLVFYSLLKELEIDSKTAGLATFLAAVNPVLLNLRFTFMTDISSLCLVLLHQFALVKGLKSNSNWFYILSGLFLVSAITIRQTSVMWVLVDFVIFCLLAYKRKFNPTYLCFVMLLPVVAAYGCDRFLESHSTMLEAYHSHKEKLGIFINAFKTIPLFVGKALFIRAGQLTSYLALFTLPLLLPFFACRSTVKDMLSRISIWHVLALVSFAAVVYSIQIFFDYMPFFRNIWQITSIGSYTLLGQVELFKDERVREYAGYFAAFLSLFFAPAAIFAIQKGFEILEQFFSDKTQEISNLDICKLYMVLTFAAGFAFTTMHLIMRTYDRYIMDLLFPALALLALSASWLKVQIKTVPAVSMILLFGIVFAGQQHTYMSWNRARWQAIDNLTASGIDKNKIEGGAEYSFHTDIKSWDKFKIDKVKGHYVPEKDKGSPPYNELRWWPVLSDEYVLSFIPLNGYTKIGSQPFTNIYPWEFDQIQIYKREPQAKTASAENISL